MTSKKWINDEGSIDNRGITLTEIVQQGMAESAVEKVLGVLIQLHDDEPDMTPSYKYKGRRFLIKLEEVK